MPSYLISQPAIVVNAYINKSLFTYERTRKITLVANSIANKLLKFTSRGLEISSTRWVYIRRGSSGAFSVCYKKFLDVLKVIASNIYFSNMIFPLIFMKMWLILIKNKKDFLWIKIEEIPE